MGARGTVRPCFGHLGFDSPTHVTQNQPISTAFTLILNHMNDTYLFLDLFRCGLDAFSLLSAAFCGPFGRWRMHDPVAIPHSRFRIIISAGLLKVKSAWPRAMGQGPGHALGPMGAAFLLGSWSLALAFTDCQDSAVLKKQRVHFAHFYNCIGAIRCSNINNIQQSVGRGE